MGMDAHFTSHGTAVSTAAHTFTDTAHTPHTPLSYTPFFCKQGQDPYTLVEWKLFQPVLKDGTGNVLFAQKDVEAPADWSERAVRIVAQKYFRGQLGTPERETSVRQMVSRVVETIGCWAMEQGYFAAVQDIHAFCSDLTYLLLTQHGTFTSPVWFNLGVADTPQQVSACFVQSVQDTMESIAELQRNETMIFKRGSGSGTNISTLRSRKEKIKGGGRPSGPISFMEGLDAWGGVIKSGGTTRRAAAMRILNVDHPDILDFINCKLEEEKKAQALIAAGYSAQFNDPNGAYASVKFQNANHTVRVPDEFMLRVQHALKHPEEEVTWDLRAVTTGEVLESVPVLKLWNAICDAAWQCGDPGMQFHDTHNAWHTCPEDGPLTGTNPCSEFTFLDDTSCNLASLNLLKFDTGCDTATGFDWKAFRKAVEVFIIAQEIMVTPAYYPTEKIGEMTRCYRPLGLGFANLGAYLMATGQPYDSDEGRNRAAAIMSEMTATAYHTSAKIAATKGPFDAYARNRNHVEAVLQRHLAEARQHNLPVASWNLVIQQVRKSGLRNAQVTVLAPTGTTSMMMDCETTGCEPESSLYKTKHLVGGGVEVLDNRIVNRALDRLGYGTITRGRLLKYLLEHKTLEGSDLREEHLAVFDCAIPSAGERVLSLDAHLQMTAALQPFLSGSISKTINAANNATVQDISKTYIDAWRLGIKSITVYRDGCKQSQPLQTKQRNNTQDAEQPVERAIPTYTPIRKKLADHQINTHRIKFCFGNVKGYMHVTPYEDTGLPGELFVTLAKEGSTISGLVDGWAQAISYCLQFGVPLATLVEKFSNTKFEPAGFSSDSDIRHASSIYDALMRKLAAVFLNKPVPLTTSTHSPVPTPAPTFRQAATLDAPLCDYCGTLMERSGASCHHCPSCGTSSGCG